MRAAAERIEIAPGIRLARHLYTHIDPYDRGIVIARLREAAKHWPSDHAPQAFLLLYARDISGTTVTLAGGRELTVKNRIRHIGINQLKIGPPYLVLAVVGEHNPREGYAALRAYAQPVARPSSFVAVHNRAERDTIVGLLDLQYRLRRRGIGIGFKRLLFDIATRAGVVRSRSPPRPARLHHRRGHGSRARSRHRRGRRYARAQAAPGRDIAPDRAGGDDPRRGSGRGCAGGSGARPAAHRMR